MEKGKDVPKAYLMTKSRQRNILITPGFNFVHKSPFGLQATGHQIHCYPSHPINAKKISAPRIVLAVTVYAIPFSSLSFYLRKNDVLVVHKTRKNDFLVVHKIRKNDFLVVHKTRTNDVLVVHITRTNDVLVVHKIRKNDVLVVPLPTALFLYPKFHINPFWLMRTSTFLFSFWLMRTSTFCISFWLTGTSTFLFFYLCNLCNL